MTEPQQDKVPDADKLVEKINSTLEQKLNEQKDWVSSKLDTIKKDSKKDNDDDEMDWVGSSDDDDDGYVTKKDLKKITQTIVEKTSELAEKRGRSAASEIVSEHSERTSRDVQAYKDFPAMNREASDFSDKFVKAVKDEIETRVSRGRSRDDADLLYDAAAKVNAEWMNKGLLVPRHIAEEEQRKLNNREQVGAVKGGGSGDGKPNASQIAYAESLGLNKDRITQLREKYRKNQ